MKWSFKLQVVVVSLEFTKSNTVKATPASELQKPLRFIKGVGEKLAELFAKKGIFTLEDALLYFPRAYEDRRILKSPAEVTVNETVTVMGKIKKAYPVYFSRTRRRAFEVILEDPSGLHVLKLVWFHGPFQKDQFKEGHFVMARGEVQNFRQSLQIVHPDIELLGKNFEPGQVAKGIMPVYSETSGLFQKTIRKIIRSVVNQYGHFVEETLPTALLQKYQFQSRHESIRYLHFPPADADFLALQEKRSLAHQRFVFEEFFELGLGLSLKRNSFVQDKGISFKRPEKTWEVLKNNLPFRFTNAQKRVLHEVLEDMVSDQRMHRLVQGDVGCGKTVVAAASALVALESGYQVAFMAPTEILVEQHFRNFSKWFEGLSFPLVKLVGSMKAAEKKSSLEKLKEKEPMVVFGTHALFEDPVKLGHLGLVIVDEQHRFGVRQRAALLSKGDSPDLLVMTATPIPRTLALTLYGDLNLSVIDELPPGRKPIVTKAIFEKQRVFMQNKILEELQKGRQVYMVFPLIEESENLKLKSIDLYLDELRSTYSGYRVETLHGKMKGDLKQSLIGDFRNQEISILVSTTVIEVGIDNPNASVMVIENAERFGLSQLHQLRGRIGRGSEDSFCFLVAAHRGTSEILQRLKTMEESQDGFKIAEVDLEMRGAGEFLGTRQSGLPQFRTAQLPRDLSWLYKAKNEAEAWVREDPSVEKLSVIKKRLESRLVDLDLN